MCLYYYCMLPADSDDSSPEDKKERERERKKWLLIPYSWWDISLETKL